MKKVNSTTITIILLYVLTFTALILGALGHQRTAVLIFAIMLIVGSILGFVKKALTFQSISTTSAIIHDNSYKDGGIILRLLGHIINGIMLFFGLSLVYYVIFICKDDLL